MVENTFPDIFRWIFADAHPSTYDLTDAGLIGCSQTFPVESYTYIKINSANGNSCWQASKPNYSKI